ncbi:MAG: J domain-containing protein [Bdellovibrionales bacterium]|jgi:curved DNA-binding protein CbpA
MSQKKMDLYEVVGLPKTASRTDIADAIDTLRIELHTDSIKNDPDRAQKEARYKLLDEAKQTLLNAEKRAAYDRGGYDAVARLNSGASSGPSPYASRPGTPVEDIRPPADFSLTGLADFARRSRERDGAAPASGSSQTPSPSPAPRPVSTGGDDFAARMAAKRAAARAGGAAPAAEPEPAKPAVPREVGYAQTALENVKSVLTGPDEIPLDVLTAFQQNLSDVAALVGQKIKKAPSGPRP